MASSNSSSLPEGLDQIYRNRSSGLWQVAGRVGRDEAPDLVHDAVIKTLEAGRKEDIHDPVGFLFRVTRNTLFDRFRSKVRRSRVLEFGLEEDDAHDTGASPERTVIASERLQLVMAFIETMPPRRREAFLLCRLEDLTYAQAARRMGVTVHAIEKHMTAAMAQLFAEFETD
jgi:RNA polymerase sigma-70 factor (ECF subfamily)